MENKVIEFLSQPFVFELIKSLIAFNFGLLVGIFYKDWQAERREKRNDANSNSEAEQAGKGE